MLEVLPIEVSTRKELVLNLTGISSFRRPSITHDSHSLPLGEYSAKSSQLMDLVSLKTIVGLRLSTIVLGSRDSLVTRAASNILFRKVLGKVRTVFMSLAMYNMKFLSRGGLEWKYLNIISAHS